MTPTHLDLFSGIGGFALAAEWAGFKTVAFSEINPYASQILKQHWPHVPNLGDVRKITPRGMPHIDLLTGGFPCQPFSNAGKRRGKEDDRDLWPEMFRLINEIRPTYVCGENVAGFISMELDRTLSDLEGIGYSCIPLVIPACAVGAPHRRDRVWIIAHSDRPGLQAKGAEQQPAGIAGEDPYTCDTSEQGFQDGGSEALGGQKQIAEPERSNSRITSHPKSQQNIGSGQLGLQPLTSQCDSNAPHASDQGLQGHELGSAFTEGRGAPRSIAQRFENEHWYEAATRFCRMDHGVSNRVDRLKGLGNAIVPTVAYPILKAIRETLTPTHPFTEGETK